MISKKELVSEKIKTSFVSQPEEITAWLQEQLGNIYYHPGYINLAMSLDYLESAVPSFIDCYREITNFVQLSQALENILWLIKESQRQLDSIPSQDDSLWEIFSQRLSSLTNQIFDKFGVN